MKKVILDQREIERLIYNDLDPMQAYPEKISGALERKAEKKLKERINTLLLEGEFVQENPLPGYALTNYGRVISGKKVPFLKIRATKSDIILVLEDQRINYSEALPNFDYSETLNKLKELKYPIQFVGDFYGE